MRESDTSLVAMRDVYVSHPAAPTFKTVPIDVSAHARVNYFVNRRKFVVFEMFYSYLRHYMSSGVHHPAVAKHDDVQRRVRSAALKHTLKGVFKKAKFESTQSVAVLTQELSLSLRPVISNKIIDIVKRSSQIIIITILSNVVICIRI